MHLKKPKYIVVTGGVISGLGKGIVTASICNILQAQGFKVSPVKIDPYINLDAGTMRPTEHGEVFVTDDGGETDQDLGNYERFLHKNLTRLHNITTGQVYQTVIQKERNLEFGGKCVEVIPHIPHEVQRRIKDVAEKDGTDFVVIEIGGTIGDYQNVLFLEAVREMKRQDNNVIFVHVVYLPIPSNLGEMKTKPAQHSVRDLMASGIQPDFIVGRGEKHIDEVRKDKLALFCNVKKEDIISAPDVDTIYKVPLLFEEQSFTQKILKKFGIAYKTGRLKTWKNLIDKINKSKNIVRIGIVGKYFDIGDFSLEDSYISVIEAIKHASYTHNAKPVISWIDSKSFEMLRNSEQRNLRALVQSKPGISGMPRTRPGLKPGRFLSKGTGLSYLNSFDGIIVPGGFGSAGTEGKIMAINYCRIHNIPFLGLCFGFQLAVVEFARNVCKMKDANTTEINPKTPYPVIDILPEQVKNIKASNYGGTMRLGAWPAKLKKRTLAYSLYEKEIIYERHRHRYEVNPKFISTLESNGLVFSGISLDRRLMEFLEVPNHSFFLATQAHPELKSRPLEPSPCFLGLVKAAVSRVKEGQK